MMSRARCEALIASTFFSFYHHAPLAYRCIYPSFPAARSNRSTPYLPSLVYDNQIYLPTLMPCLSFECESCLPCLFSLDTYKCSRHAFVKVPLYPSVFYLSCERCLVYLQTNLDTYPGAHIPSHDEVGFRRSKVTYLYLTDAFLVYAM